MNLYILFQAFWQAVMNYLIKNKVFQLISKKMYDQHIFWYKDIYTDR